MLKHPCVDLTDLSPYKDPKNFEALCAAMVTGGALRKLCENAAENANVVRSICIPYLLVDDAKRILESMHSAMRVCAVNDFPDGMGGVDEKERQAKLAKLAGADEIDTVINREKLFGNDSVKAFFELLAVTRHFPDFTKVILETGDKRYDERSVKNATRYVEESWAFCVKTSTGFNENIPVEEKVQHVKWMHEAAPNLMIKVAGGVRTLAQAQLFLDAVPEEKLIFGASAVFWKA